MYKSSLTPPPHVRRIRASNGIVAVPLILLWAVHMSLAHEGRAMTRSWTIKTDTSALAHNQSENRRSSANPLDVLPIRFTSGRANPRRSPRANAASHMLASIAHLGRSPPRAIVFKHHRMNKIISPFRASISVHNPPQPFSKLATKLRPCRHRSKIKASTHPLVLQKKSPVHRP